MVRVALTLDEGADNSIHLVSSQEVEGVSGKYFVGRVTVPSSPLSCDAALACRKWTISTAITASASALCLLPEIERTG
ncbi:MAG: hypothetical protein JXA97_10665 [Anaerolineales bacterium]|nr:hypothetical protein [Anaerolineales bacterium]